MGGILKGGLYHSLRKKFWASVVRIEMIYSRGNVIFYCLEPEVGDGFTGRDVFNDYLDALDVEKHSVSCPTFMCLNINNIESP